MRAKPNNARRAKKYELIAAAFQVGTGVKFASGYVFKTQREAVNWARGNAYLIHNPLTDEWLVCYQKIDRE